MLLNKHFSKLCVSKDKGADKNKASSALRSESYYDKKLVFNIYATTSVAALPTSWIDLCLND